MHAGVESAIPVSLYQIYVRSHSEPLANSGLPDILGTSVITNSGPPDSLLEVSKKALGEGEALKRKRAQRSTFKTYNFGESRNFRKGVGTLL